MAPDPRRLSIDGAELRYWDEGRGKRVVLLLHAFPLHSGMWTRQLTELARSFRVVAPDARGLGLSRPAPELSSMSLLAADLRLLLAHLDVTRATVVGLSMGGYIAFELYRQAPALFSGLALCDTRAAADTEEGRANREAFAVSAVENGLGWVADQAVPKLLRPNPAPEIEAEVRALVAGGTALGVAAAQRGMAARPDSTGTLATIACPSVVIVGEQDQLTPPAEAAAMAQALPGARLELIPDAGHLPCIENPEAFGRALATIL
jgi:pimeloyl-ACP methyl ester carboxylesterase